MLDATKDIAMGEGRATIDCRRQQGDRYEMRWRAHLHTDGHRNFRQRFDRAGDADEFIKRPNAVGLTGSTWALDDEGRRGGFDAASCRRCHTPAAPSTAWAALTYRSATWRGASDKGQKGRSTAAARVGQDPQVDAPTLPNATRAHLDLAAFRAETEPDEFSLRAEKFSQDGRMFSAVEIIAGPRLYRAVVAPTRRPCPLPHPRAHRRSWNQPGRLDRRQTVDAGARRLAVVARRGFRRRRSHVARRRDPWHQRSDTGRRRGDP